MSYDWQFGKKKCFYGGTCNSSQFQSPLEWPPVASCEILWLPLSLLPRALTQDNASATLSFSSQASLTSELWPPKSAAIAVRGPETLQAVHGV